jgi:two-component system cell cycle response regulator DivK
MQALIIDDNATNLVVLKQALELEGITPLLYDTPRDIDAILSEAQQIDIVFLDLEFPNYNGLDLIKEFKQDPRLADVPFVAYTVHISEQNEALAAGFHSFLGKPLNVDSFPEQLRRILDGEPIWDTGQ